MIYADNAATTALAPEAFEAMKPYLLTEYGNASQPYSFSRSARAALAKARQDIAECINAEPSEIYFTSGGTESDNWAIKCLASDRRALLTSMTEHKAVLRSCAAMERRGYPAAYLPVDRSGIVLPETLERFISDTALLVSVMTANNETGTIQPVAELCRIAHAHGALFHTDAVQALGHIPVDVKSLGVDMLSGSAHKFGGPKGAGFLYVRSGTPLTPYADGGAQERGLRAGTENVAGAVGMAAALKKSCAAMPETAEKLRRMERDLLAELHGADFIRNGAPDGIPGNMSLSFRGAEGEMLLHRLDLMGICVSTGSACDSARTQISHVLDAMGVPEEYAAGTIRVSFGAGNSPEDGKLVGQAIRKIIGSPLKTLFE